MKRYGVLSILMLTLMLVAMGCSGEEMQTAVTDVMPQVEESEIPEIETETKEEEETKVNYSMLFNSFEKNESYKTLMYNNPLITQEFGADPYALVYDDTLYIYMTQDALEYELDGTVKDNTYSKIKTIRCISTKDMVNWTDNGEIKVAGSNGAAKWAKNSWAPAVVWKNVDGKDQFYMYFADSGNGIGVVRADSPVGPFEDPIGGGLITRNTPNCADVAWLFDPAVLVDDDGRAYIYFGGGVPEGKAEHPLTGRCVELGDDMISIKGEPVLIDAPYLFEDSGIHKFNNKYYYTYCNNWTGEENRKNYGFGIADIAMMESDNPLGPFKLKEVILENPNAKFGISSNNHHCVFNFRGQWYMTYHTRTLERDMGFEKGYRCTFINPFTIKEDGSIGKIAMNYEGAAQSGNPNPYSLTNATTMSHQAGLATAPANADAAKYGSGEQKLTGIDSGDFFRVKGVDFTYKKADKLTVNVRKTDVVDENCVIEVRSKSLRGDVLCHIPVGDFLKDKSTGTYEFLPLTVDIKNAPTEVTDLYFIFSGAHYELLNWQFSGEEENWYDKMLEDALVSKGSNGRIQKVFAKLEAGETVNIGMIGGSITEGAGASKITESYADQVIAKLSAKYPKAKINYVNAGIGGTPSALGVMRWQRDLWDKVDGNLDLLLIEFSVNDWQECTGGRAYESMIKQALDSSDDTAVALLFAVFKSRWNMQDTYIPIGEAYGLPMISIKNATDPLAANGTITDEKFFSDDYHPTTYGHTIMADCIVDVLCKAGENQLDSYTALPQKAVTACDFMNMTLITADDLNGAKVNAGGFKERDTQSHILMRTALAPFPANWKHAAGATGDFEMEITCQHLMINFKRNGNADIAGSVDIYVDGNLVKTLDSFENGGWNQSFPELVIDEKSTAAHKVSIKMKDEAKEFTIFGFAYN